MTRWPVPCVYLVTDRRRLSPGARTTADEVVALEAFLDRAIDAGVDALQIRERDLEARDLRALAARVAARARGRALVLVNDRADVALAAGLDGVHLRADGAPTGEVKRLGPPGWMVGRSVHGAEEAGGEIAADYVLFGTVFEGGSKAAGAPLAGLDGLRAAAGACHAPVVAIGGITPERAARAMAAGARGVAAIGVFLPPGLAPGAMGVVEAARALRAAVG
jgi:thiamine-phosphate pyrophosphorylase